MQQIMFASLAAGGGGYVIEGSGLFTDEYIKRTEVDGSSDQKMYFSCVVKPAKINKAQALFYVSDAANYTERSWIAIGQTGNHIELLDIKAGSVQLSLVTTAAFRDFSAYLHIEVLYDTTQSTAADRNILKVNGTRITDFSTETNFTQNDTFGSAGISGEFAGVGGTVLTGGSSECYIAQAVRVDGDPAGIALGETTDDGFYQLKDPSEESLTFGNNGFLLSGQNLATGTNTSVDQTSTATYAPVSVHFDGTNDRLGIDGYTAPSDNKTGTFSSWFKLDAGASSGSIIEIASGTLILAVGPTGTLYWYVHNPSVAIIGRCTSATNVTLGHWHHVIVSWDLANARIQMFVDGVSNITIITNTNQNVAWDYNDEFYVGDNITKELSWS